MTTDSYGNALTSRSEEATRLFDAYVEQHLNYGPDLGVIFKIKKHDPEDPYLNAQCAAVHMGLEAAEGFRAARPFLEVASDGLEPGRVSVREREFIEATFAFARHEIHEAADRLSHIAARWPTDISAAKWAQYHHFNLGQAHGMLEVSEAILPALQGQAFVHGMYAFALEQNNRYAEAEAEALRSIEICRQDPWAHHAVAHVMEMEGRVEEGDRFMSGFTTEWEKAGIFIREHNWWHRALFKLDLEDHAAALKIYDDHLWGEWPEFAQEQIGAVSALWRMELRGIDVGERWAPVAKAIAARELEHVQPFHDLHYIFALARSGDREGVEAFLASLIDRAEGRSEEGRKIWLATCLPLAKALVAYAQGAFEEAFEGLDGLIGSLPIIGGSHAQRDIFVQSWIDLMIRTGRLSAARSVLEHRLATRPEVLVTRKQLEQVAGA